MIVYAITNKINGKQYVGQTIRSLKERWAEHCKKTSDCSAIIRAIQKYGKENFTIQTIYTAVSIEELNKKEQEFIKEFNTFKPNGYNLTTGGLNYLRSDETKQKFSDVQKGKKNHRFGTKASEETRRKQSESHRGTLNHFFGKTHSKETLQKLSEASKGSNHSQFGTHHSQKSKDKAAASNPMKKSVVCNENGVFYQSIASAARALGVRRNGIRCVLNGKQRSCGGFTFSYFQS